MTIDQWLKKHCRAVPDVQQSGRFWDKSAVLFNHYKASVDPDLRVSVRVWRAHMNKKFKRRESNGTRYIGIKINAQEAT